MVVSRTNNSERTSVPALAPVFLRVNDTVTTGWWSLCSVSHESTLCTVHGGRLTKGRARSQSRGTVASHLR